MKKKLAGPDAICRSVCPASSQSEIKQNNKAILVIDVYAEQKEKEIDNICSVLKSNSQCPAFIFEYDFDMDTWKPCDSAHKPKFNEKILDAAGPGAIKMFKNYIDAFFSTNLADTLRKMGVDTVLVSGFRWNVCVQESAASALEQKFGVISSPELMYGEFQNDTESLSFFKSKTIFCNSIKEINSLLAK